MFGKKTVIIIEDNNEDFLSISNILLEKEKDIKIYWCQDGEEANNCVGRLTEGYALKDGTLNPLLFILDLNLPGINGLEILEKLKNSKRLRKIPVIVFSNSDYMGDISSCYDNGANSYMQKPLEIEDFDDTIRLIKKYWIEKSKLPRELK